MGTVSPKQGSKVIVNEINLSQVIISTSSSVAAEVIVSTQGRTVPVQFTNGTDYLNEYGIPTAAISFDQYCALDYFREGSDLWGLRIAGAGALYSAVLMYSNTAGTQTSLLGITAGVINPVEPDWAALTPVGGNTAIALFYPLRGPGSYGQTLSIGLTSTNISTPTGFAAASANTGGVLPAATYQYQISAVSVTGETLGSSPLVVVIAGVSVVNSVTLSWNAVNQAIAYNIYGRTSGGTFGFIAQVGAGTVSFLDTGAVTPDVTKQPVTSIANVVTSPYFNVLVYNNAVSTSYAVENFSCTLTDNTDSSGMETELEQAINPFSSNVQVTSNVPAWIALPDITTVAATAMGGGASGSAPNSANIAGAWATFSNKQLYPINLLINSGHTSSTDASVGLAMDSLAQSRGDCVALLDVPSVSQQFQAAINYRNLVLNLNSTYSALFGPDVLEPDTYNGKQQYVPFSGWAAALCARTDRVANPSFSIAGLNRGLINVLKTRYTYDQGEMDLLFDAQVNYTQTFIGQGIALWEQQTLAANFSALSWLSVRRIVNVLKVALYNFLLYSLQEPNDDFLGRQIVESCSSYLQTLQNARALSGFTVVSDASNNSAQDFNSGIRNVTVIIIPVIPTHIINLQVVVSKQGVSFAEVLSTVQPG